MKIALIGGSGFVGTHLITRLQKNGQQYLRNLDKQQSTAHPDLTTIVDVSDTNGLTEALRGMDAVVLLAAEHRDDVAPISLYYDVNVQGLRNTLEAMERNAIRHMLFTSSVAIYGLGKDNPDENTTAAPFNHYGKSKYEAECLLSEWYSTHTDWRIAIIRPTVIFGEGNRGNVFNLLQQIARGKFMMIGSGNNQKSMCYIGNMAAFLEFLLRDNKPGYEVYNYVDKPDFTTNDLVNYTGKILGKRIPTLRIPYWLGILGGYGFDILAFVVRKKLPISAVRVKKFCAVTRFDSTKAMQSGFVPPYTMQEGLARTLKGEFQDRT